MGIGIVPRLRALGWRPAARDLDAALRSAHPRVVHLGGYWRGENDIVRQMRLGLEAAGAELLEISTDARPDLLDHEGRPRDRGTSGPAWLRWERLAGAVLDFRPHAIVCNAGGLAFRPPVAGWLRRRCALLGIAWSDPGVFLPTTSRISPLFDLFLSNHEPSVARHRASGARAGVVPFATHPASFHPVPPLARWACDAVVVGRAHDDRIAPVQALRRRFDVQVHGERWEELGISARPHVHGEELLAVLASARAALVFARSPAGEPLLKPQVFDFAAAGALVITEDSEALRRHFVPGEEVEVYRSLDELPDLLAGLLADPSRCQRLRQAGRERALRDHTWERAWPRILAQLASSRLP